MSATTYAFVRSMRLARVFRNINPQLLLSDSPEILVLCFDPQRFNDKWEHYRMLGGNCRCCTPVPYPGGSLVLPEHSPLARTPEGDRVDRVLLHAIRFAQKKLGADKIRPYVHYPCAMVGEAGLSDLEALQLHVDAKDRLRREFPGTDIALMVHVDWHGYREAATGAMKTYSFNRSAFAEFLRTGPKNPASVAA